MKASTLTSGFAAVLTLNLGAMAKPLVAEASSLQEYCSEVQTVQGRLSRIASLFSLSGSAAVSPEAKRYKTHKLNQGGLLNKGICWWISRFQRNILYLARLNPQLPRPTRAEAQKLIQDVIQVRGPVEIPGYHSVYAFSVDYKEDIREALEKWQLRDSIRGSMRTLHPLRPTFYRKNPYLFEEAATAKQMLERHGALPYLMLQNEGLTAHSWLVLQVQPLYKKPFQQEMLLENPHFPVPGDAQRPQVDPQSHSLIGYRLYVEDPNDALYYVEIFRGDDQVTAFYSITDPTRSYNIINGESPFPYYIDWVQDLDRLESAIEKSCRHKLVPSLYSESGRWGTYR